MSDIKKGSEPPADSGRDRRDGVRHFACFPAHVVRVSGSTRMALIRDLSVTGALLLTRERLTVGESVRLSLYLSTDVTEARPTTARVVRVEALREDRAEVWHHSAAVQFTTPLLDCEAEIKELAERQAALGILRD